MKIKWNGHACFTITAGDGVVIVTDPYEPGSFGGGIGYGPVDDKADVVLISHDHADHNYTGDLKGDFQVLKGSGSKAGIEFEAVSAAHDASGGSERGKNTLFAFEVDGVRVAFMGDLGHQLTDGQVAALGKVHVLFTPVGGVFTVDPPAAAKVIEQLGPKVVIPMHYKTEKCGFPLATVDEFAKHFTNVKKTGKSEIEIDGESLPAGPEVWILEHAR